MGSDMVVALKEASANGTTLFGLNHHSAQPRRYQVQRIPRRQHGLGEMMQVGGIELPQARETFGALGVQPVGEWGFAHGVNEHSVAIGVTQWQSRLASTAPTLTGAALVRLTLERSPSALHAIEILTDLVCRHGQGAIEVNTLLPRDHIFLIADRNEAYVLETAGRYWALLECHHTRVVTDVAMIRQDWRKLAPGLAEQVIQQGWWANDGSKIDFVRCLNEDSARAKAAQRRWGRASLALAQQQGAIDTHFLRHMLAGHYEQMADTMPNATPPALVSSFLVDLHKSDQPLLAWVAFGSPNVAIYFPLCLVGDLPPVFGGGHPEAPTLEQHTHELEKLARGKTKDRQKLTYALEKLQTRFDQDAEEFLFKTLDRKQTSVAQIAHLATEMMHNHVELFDKEYRALFNLAEKPPQPAQIPEEVMYFA